MFCVIFSFLILHPQHRASVEGLWRVSLPTHAAVSQPYSLLDSWAWVTVYVMVKKMGIDDSITSK